MSAEATAVRGVTRHRLGQARDARGSLAVADFGADVPFVPRRCFVVYDVPGAEVRGEHAHRRCHQFLVCIRGACSLVVDDGRERAQMRLDSPALGVYVPPMVWAEQHGYTPDAMLLVLASDPYDPADYIRRYDEFVALAAGRAPR
jgi:UDP-2-acetamido-3-amino-2,3-dideoxy-glucuronate N-acetyltransferase